MNVKSLELTAAVRGFDEYRNVWKPYLNEILSCPHERNNVFDIFASKCEKGKDFAWIYFRESITSKLFAESYFREFGQKPRKSRKLIPRSR